MATSRLRRVSRAFHTSPMPPAPRAERISYGPSRVPDVRAMELVRIIAMGKFSLHPRTHLERPNVQLHSNLTVVGARPRLLSFTPMVRGRHLALTAVAISALSGTGLGQTDANWRTSFLKVIDRPKVAANVVVQALPNDGDLTV